MSLPAGPEFAKRVLGALDRLRRRRWPHTTVGMAEQRAQMRPDYTHITVILDRTGSMESIRDDTIGGFNAFLRAQQDESGTATLTLVEFDSQNPYEVVHRFKPIAEVPELTRETYVPRAQTPLLDAFGRGINDVEAGLAGLGDCDRPSKVIFVVVTDGAENASREFRKHDIEQMVREKTEKQDWQFVFLSADLAAIRDAMAMGVHTDAVLLFQKNWKSTADMWASLSRSSSDVRTGRRRRIGFEQDGRSGLSRETSHGKRPRGLR